MKTGRKREGEEPEIEKKFSLRVNPSGYKTRISAFSAEIQFSFSSARPTNTKEKEKSNE